MRRKRGFVSASVRKTGLMFAGLLAAFILAGASFSGARAEEAGPDGKTLTRADDYIVVKGKQLEKNLGKRIENLSLLALVKGKVVPVPFQVDEIDKEGEWVLDMVPPCLAGKGITPDEDEDKGCLDKNDELVFMVRDSGSRISKDRYPDGAVEVDEIALEDPIDGGKAWVYLCSFPADPPRSEVDYVAYKIEKDRVVTSNYEMGFNPELAIAPGHISLQGSENIIDRLKIRFWCKVIGVQFFINENDLTSRLELYRDGPIRVIRRTRTAIYFTKVFRSPYGSIENIYYENTVIVPVKVEIPISLRFFKRILTVKVLAGPDFQNLHGWRIKTDGVPDWLSIDGKMDESEWEAQDTPFSWFVLSSAERAFMIRVLLDRQPDWSRWDSPMSSILHYRDDDAEPDPPEFVPGQSPYVGFNVQDILELGKCTFFLVGVLHLLKDYQEGIEERYLDIIDRPIEVRVN